MSTGNDKFENTPTGEVIKQSGSTEQLMGIVDLICEGPIKGLVNGNASVFLDDIPFESGTVLGQPKAVSLPGQELSVSDFPSATFSDANTLTFIQGYEPNTKDIGKYCNVNIKVTPLAGIKKVLLNNELLNIHLTPATSTEFHNGTTANALYNTYEKNLFYVYLRDKTTNQAYWGETTVFTSSNAVGKAAYITNISPELRKLKYSPLLNARTQNNPVRLTTKTAHGFVEGDNVTVFDQSATADDTYFVKVINDNEVELYSDANLSSGVDGTTAFAGTLEGSIEKVGAWELLVYQASKIETIDSSTRISLEDNLSGISSGSSRADFFIADSNPPEVYINPVVASGGGPFGFSGGHNGAQYKKTEKGKIQFRPGTPDQAPIQEISGLLNGITTTGLGGQRVQLKQLNDISYLPTWAKTSANGGTGAVNLIGGVYDTSGYPEGQSFAVDGQPAPLVIPSGSASGLSFGLSAAQAKQADFVSIKINYPSLLTFNQEGGGNETAYAFYIFEIQTTLFAQSGAFPGATSEYKTLFADTGGVVSHQASTTAPISFEHVIGLEEFKPFDTFNIRITRLSRHQGLPSRADGGTGGETDKDKWNLQANSAIGPGDLSATISDKLNYPYTSLAAVTFSSKEFQNVPRRSYELDGLLVKIPTSYTPREESSDGVAKYGKWWRGDLTEDLHYTDNPAWVFFDLITNNRYGVGRWIEPEDVDLYALYRISKYCDELVSDGQGGTEPRFRANVFLTKSTDVYKVVKDMATIFTSMMYHMDGKLLPVLDAPGEAIATFSKANVIGGEFKYETSGRQTRANQIRVTYNNPKANYEPTALVVEDGDAIVRSGKIITENAVAFGCTSEAQALRVGRWKLWTAQNQHEIINFQTALNASFLRPGDIIAVQDRDRYGVDYSGRVKSFSGTTLTLDREITLNKSSSYELSTLVTAPGIFYTGLDPIKLDVDAQIDNSATPVNRGELYEGRIWYPATTAGLEDVATGTQVFRLIDLKSVGGLDIFDSTDSAGNVTQSTSHTPVPTNSVIGTGTESIVSQAHYLRNTGSVTGLAASGQKSSTGTYEAIPLPLEYRDHTFVQKDDITNSDASYATGETTRTVSSLALSASPTHNPQAETIWALIEDSSAGTQVLGSAKNYKVLVVAQDDAKQLYTISAVEHYNEKYDAVDKDYALGTIGTSIYPEVEDTSLDVPAPPNIYVQIDSDASQAGEELILHWDPATETYVDENDVTRTRDYSFFASYELRHDIEGIPNPIFLGENSYRFTGVPDGMHTFKVRTISSKGNKSTFAITTYDATDPYGSYVPRVVGGLPKGIIANTSIEKVIDSSQATRQNTHKLRWQLDNPTGISSGNQLFNPNVATTSLSDIGIFGIADAGQSAYPDSINSSLGNKYGDREWHYLLYDGTTRLGYWDTTTLNNLPYFRKIIQNGYRGSSQATEWTTVSNAGKVYIKAGTNRVLGSGTFWENNIKPRDIILPREPLQPSFERFKIGDIQTVGNKVRIIFRFIGSIENTTYSVGITDNAQVLITGVNTFYDSSTPVVTNSTFADAFNNKTFFVKRINLTTYELYDSLNDAGTVNTNDPSFVSSGSVTINVSDYQGQTTSPASGTGFIQEINAPNAAKVVAVVSNTELIIDRSFEEDVGVAAFQSGQGEILYRYGYRPDFRDDAVFGRIKHASYSSSSTTHDFTLEKFISIDPGLDLSGLNVVVTPSDPTIQYSGDGSTQITQAGVINATVTAIGFKNPQFRITGTSGGLPTPADTTTFQDPDTAGGFVYTQQITTENQGNSIAYGTGASAGAPAEITAEVREKNNPGLNATGTGFITKTIAGSDGVAGKTVGLNANDFSIIYNEAGTNPLMNGSNDTITFTATHQNFTNPEYKFTFSGPLLHNANAFTKSSNFGSFGSGATATVVVPSSYNNNWGTNKNQKTFTVKVEVRENGSNTVEAFDEVTIIGIHALRGGYWVSLSNEAHTIVTDSEGIIEGTANSSNFVVAAGSGTTIEVGKGSDILSRYEGNTAWDNLSDQDKLGFYNITFTENPDASINRGQATFSSATKLLTIADHQFSKANTGTSYWSADTASIQYTIEAENDVSVVRTQSFSKSKSGFNGITVTNSNAFESVPVDQKGAVLDMSITATNINVFLAGQNLPYYAAGATIPNNVKAHWRVESTSPTNITVGNISAPDNGSNSALVAGPHTSLTATTATIVYNILVTIGSNSETITTTQTITKNANSFNISASATNNHYNFDSDGGTPNPSTGYTLNWTVPDASAGITAVVTVDDEVQSGASKSYTVPAADDLPRTHTVKLFKDNANSNSNLLDTDTVTISKSSDGSDGGDGIIMELSNDAATINKPSNTALPESGGTLSIQTVANIFLNGTADNANWNFSIVGDPSNDGITASLGAATNTLTKRTLTISGLSAGFTTGTVTIRATDGRATPLFANHEKTFTITGLAPGAQGAAGDQFIIVPNSSAVVYDPDADSYTGGGSSSSNSINGDNQVTFNFKKITGSTGASSDFSGRYKVNGGDLQSAATSVTHSFTQETQSSVNVQLFTATGTATLLDEETVPLIIGGADGTDGISATLKATASSVTYSYDSTGNNYDPSVSSITISLEVSGITLVSVNYSGAGATSGVTRVISLDSNRTSTQVDNLGGKFDVTCSFSGTKSDGTSTGTLTRTITIPIVKSAQPGTSGSEAPRIVTGYIYTANASSSITAPASQTYTFQSGSTILAGTDSAFADLDIDNNGSNDWSVNPPTFQSSQNTIYYASYTAVESVTNGTRDNTGTVSFSQKTVGTSFTGLVTFATATGDFSDENGTITAINGGRIDTNTISANKLVIGETGRNTSSTGRLLLLDDSVKIFNGNNLRVHLGNLSNTTT